jgi:diguanylate cyclase (GGDEF)-like protein
LTFLANHDNLTSLFNRRYFLTCLEENIASKLPSETLAVILIDLARFRTINDNFGHHIGDQLLIELSGRITAWNSYAATISRLGGDEFAVLFTGKYTRKDIEKFCLQLIESCSKPVRIGNHKMSLTISAGIAVFSEESCDGYTLMKHADIAMYRAKSQGYNRFEFYNPLFGQEVNLKNKIEILLKQADFEKSFELFYQPQFSFPYHNLVGAEALIRWKSAELGYIPPSVFIPVAEEIDHIFKIGRWVMQKSIQQAAAWNSKIPLRMKIGFNVSPKQLKDESFFDILKTLLRDDGIDPAWLDAEITESIMISAEDKVRAMLHWLKTLGVSVSIDDFGAGYSSLGYLSKYPFDRIKIDKSLIASISSCNHNGTQIVKAAISMAKSLGIKTIAEGVETQEQLDILTDLGCDQAQGYLLGRPVSADMFEQLFYVTEERFRFSKCLSCARLGAAALCGLSPPGTGPDPL